MMWDSSHVTRPPQGPWSDWSQQACDWEYTQGSSWLLREQELNRGRAGLELVTGQLQGPQPGLTSAGLLPGAQMCVGRTNSWNAVEQGWNWVIGLLQDLQSSPRSGGLLMGHRQAWVLPHLWACWAGCGSVAKHGCSWVHWEMGLLLVCIQDHFQWTCH